MKRGLNRPEISVPHRFSYTRLIILVSDSIETLLLIPGTSALTLLRRRPGCLNQRVISCPTPPITERNGQQFGAKSSGLEWGELKRQSRN